MGRHCEDLEDMKDSGVLSTTILRVIGDDRYQDTWFKLSHEEVRLILFGMGGSLESMQAIKHGNLSYNDINNKAMGYRKMEIIMRWWCDHHDGDVLIFA